MHQLFIRFRLHPAFCILLFSLCGLYVPSFKTAYAQQLDIRSYERKMNVRIQTPTAPTFSLFKLHHPPRLVLLFPQRRCHTYPAPQIPQHNPQHIVSIQSKCVEQHIHWTFELRKHTAFAIRTSRTSVILSWNARVLPSPIAQRPQQTQELSIQKALLVWARMNKRLHTHQNKEKVLWKHQLKSDVTQLPVERKNTFIATQQRWLQRAYTDLPAPPKYDLLPIIQQPITQQEQRIASSELSEKYGFRVWLLHALTTSRNFKAQKTLRSSEWMESSNQEKQVFQQLKKNVYAALPKGTKALEQKAKQLHIQEQNEHKREHQERVKREQKRYISNHQYMQKQMLTWLRAQQNSTSGTRVHRGSSSQTKHISPRVSDSQTSSHPLHAMKTLWSRSLQEHPVLQESSKYTMFRAEKWSLNPDLEPHIRRGQIDEQQNNQTLEADLHQRSRRLENSLHLRDQRSKTRIQLWIRNQTIRTQSASSKTVPPISSRSQHKSKTRRLASHKTFNPPSKSRQGPPPTLLDAFEALVPTGSVQPRSSRRTRRTVTHIHSIRFSPSYRWDRIIIDYVRQTPHTSYRFQNVTQKEHEILLLRTQKNPKAHFRPIHLDTFTTSLNALYIRTIKADQIRIRLHFRIPTQLRIQRKKNQLHILFPRSLGRYSR